MLMYLLGKPVTAPRNVLVICAALSAALLAGAHLFERVGNMPPCLLCLEQREVHWAALAASLMATAVVRLMGSSDRILTAALGALALVYLFSTGIAGYHAGVEWSLWAGPRQCSGVGGSIDQFTASDLLNGLDGPSSGPSCNEAPWRMMGISMAGYNALISIGLCALALLSAFRAARGMRAHAVGIPAAAE